MNSYEIEIYNMDDDTDMHTVQVALHGAGLTDAGDGESGEYLVYGKLRSVFVDPSEVGKAVEVLNKLGYQTDEDEQTEE